VADQDAQGRKETCARHERDEVQNAGPEVALPVHLGHEVRRADVQEVPGRETDQACRVDARRGCPRGDAADEEGRGGEDVPGEGLARRPASVDEDSEVPKLLRHLVRGRGQPGGDGDTHVDEECRTHGEAAHEVVKCIADQDQRRERLTAVGVRLMAEEKIPLAGIQIPTVKTIYEPVLNALEQLNIKMEEKRFKSR